MRILDDSSEYYRMRELQERDAAARAPNDAIAEIHLTLDREYRKLAEEAEKLGQ